MKLFLRFEVEGLFVENVPQKLKKAGIPVFFVQKKGKNGLYFCVDRKFRKKVFTILSSSCYNILGIKYHGVLYFLSSLKKRVGLLLGGVLFVAVCLLSTPFIFRIEVTGNGNYLKPEILSVLEKNGYALGKAYNADALPTATAEILSLSGVGYASIRRSGGALLVQVETYPQGKKGEEGDLVSNASGTLVQLVALSGEVVRGEGERVSCGEVLIRQTGALVIGYAVVECSVVGTKEECLMECERTGAKLTKYENGTGWLSYTVTKNMQ